MSTLVYAFARASAFLATHVVIRRATGQAAPWIVIALAIPMLMTTLDLNAVIVELATLRSQLEPVVPETGGVANVSGSVGDSGSLAVGSTMSRGALADVIGIDGLALVAELLLGAGLGAIASLVAAAVLGGVETSLEIAGLEARASTLLTTWLAIVSLAACLEAGLWLPAMQAWQHLAQIVPFGSGVAAATYEQWFASGTLSVTVLAACGSGLLLIALSSATPVLLILVVVDLTAAVLGTDELGMSAWTRWLRLALALAMTAIAWGLHLALWAELPLRRAL